MPSVDDLLVPWAKDVMKLNSQEVQDEFEDPPEGYPLGKVKIDGEVVRFDKALKGHAEAVERIINALENGKIAILASPTGSGKTAVYLTVISRLEAKAMIVLPRNGLQDEVSSYLVDFEILELLGKDKVCPFVEEKGAERAPCLARVNGKFYFDGKLYTYPCKDCPVYNTIQKFKSATGGPLAIVVNQGNFWAVRHYADLVVVDEADEVARSISEQVTVFVEEVPPEPVDMRLELARSVIEERIRAIEEELAEYTPDDLKDPEIRNRVERLNDKLDAYKRKLAKLNFFAANVSNVLSIVERAGNGWRLKFRLFDMDPLNIFKRLFYGKKVLLVTATPPLDAEGYEVITFERPMKARIYYVPLENMSVANTRRTNGQNFHKPAEFIQRAYTYVVNLLGLKKGKTVIHAGNLHTHARLIANILSNLNMKVMTMEESKQREIVRTFLSSDEYDTLVVVAAEYGYDWDAVPIQFILKVPYANKGDPWIQEIKRVLGVRFDEWYAWDALTRVIQASGRNARRPDRLGVTVIVDTQFGIVMSKFADKVPKWFMDRLYVVTKGGVIPAKEVFLNAEGNGS